MNNWTVVTCAACKHDNLAPAEQGLLADCGYCGRPLVAMLREDKPQPRTSLFARDELPLASCVVCRDGTLHASDYGRSLLCCCCGFCIRRTA
jgi:hypothetical protein